MNTFKNIIFWIISLITAIPLFSFIVIICVTGAIIITPYSFFKTVCACKEVFNDKNIP